MKEHASNPEVKSVKKGYYFSVWAAFWASASLSYFIGILVAKSVAESNEQMPTFLMTFLVTFAFVFWPLMGVHINNLRLNELLKSSLESARLGSNYLQGRGVIKSAQIAEDHYEKAINGFSKVANESTNAETCLSCAESLDALAKDDGLTAHPATKFNDMRLVAMAYLRAALLGSPAAQFKVALHYQDGIGFSTDFCEAYAWFNICAASKYFGGESARESLACRMNPDEISLAQKRSLELLAMVNGKA